MSALGWAQQAVGALLVAALLIAGRAWLVRPSRRQVTALWTWRTPLRLYLYCDRCGRVGRPLVAADVADLAAREPLPAPHLCPHCMPVKAVATGGQSRTG